MSISQVQLWDRQDNDQRALLLGDCRIPSYDRVMVWQARWRCNGDTK